MTTATTPTHRKAGKAKRPDGTLVTLWRVERESPDLWCHISGRNLVEREEFTKMVVPGHKGPVPVCQRVAPFTVVKRG